MKKVNLLYITAFLLVSTRMFFSQAAADRLYLTLANTGHIYDITALSATPASAVALPAAVTNPGIPGGVVANASNLAVGYDQPGGNPNNIVFIQSNTAGSSTLYKNGNAISGTTIPTGIEIGGIATNNVPGPYFGNVYGFQRNTKVLYPIYPSGAAKTITGDTIWTDGATLGTDTFFDYQNNIYMFVNYPAVNPTSRYLYKISIGGGTAQQVVQIAGTAASVTAIQGMAYLQGSVYIATVLTSTVEVRRINIFNGSSSLVATYTGGGGQNIDLATVPYYVPFQFNCAGITQTSDTPFVKGVASNSQKFINIPINNVYADGAYTINIIGADFNSSSIVNITTSTTSIQVPLNYNGNASGASGVRTLQVNLNGSTTACNVNVLVDEDTDGDGIGNSQDLDDDNDGILDADEGCSGAVTMSTIPAARITDLINNNTAVFPLTGAPLTQNGVRVTRNNGGNGWQAYTPTQSTATAAVNGITSSPFPSTYLDVIDTGTITGVARNLTIDYGQAANSLNTATNSYQYIIGIAGLGGEGAATISDIFSVPVTVASNFNVFNTNLYSYFGGIVPVPGATGTTVSTNTTSTPTAQGYTYFLVPRDLSSFSINMVGGNDRHGIIFGVYSTSCNVDTDGDGIPDSLDTDSDNDGCPDAIEGSEAVRFDQVHSMALPVGNANYNYRGQIKVTYNGTTTGTPAQIISTSPSAIGVPQLVNNAGFNLNATTNPSNLGGLVDNTDGTSDIGQGIGTSQNALTRDVECDRCFRPATTPGVGGEPTNQGFTALARAGGGTTDWPIKIKGAYTALDAKTKGFVINRVPTASLTSIVGVAGMMVYDTTENCLKVYDGTSWSCFSKQTCNNFNQ